MTAIIYSGPHCGKCIATKVAFKARGIPFVERMAQDHIDAVEDLMREHGLSRSLPIVAAGDLVWNDFRLDLIGDLAARALTDG